MEYFIIIGIEVIAWSALIVCWVKYDARIKAWEDRQILKLRRIVRRQLLRFCKYLDLVEQRYHRTVRKIRREICARLLEKDNLTVAPMYEVGTSTVEETYAEVMRLLEE